MSNQIEEVKEKTDIVSIIGESVKLTKAGTNYKGLCPFHNEKSPSFMVSQELQIYKCFGCGEGGDVFTFLEKYDGMDFGEALKFLADKAGVKLEPLQGQNSSDKEKVFDLQKLAANYYKYVLHNSKEGEIAKKYLAERKISDKTIEQFELGFAPERPNALSKFLVEKKGYKNKDLVEAGLAIETSRGLMDRFRGRIIFPIFDHRGNAIALAGRILPQFDTGKMGKYINSPETAIYHKSRSLYGLNVTRSAIKRAGKAIVVEGEVDAISSWQAGIQNVVAIKGSALTEEQVTLLSRYAQTFVLALDADFAGDNASIRAISQAHLKGVDVQVADMNPHKDPDEFAQSDPAGYKKALESAIGIWDFMINLSMERHDKSTGAGKSAISRELTPVIASIPDEIVRSHYVGVVAQKLGVPVEAVLGQVSKSKSFLPEQKEADPVRQRVSLSRREMIEEQVIALAYKNKIAKIGVDNFVDLFSVPILKKIAEHFINEKGKLNSMPAEIKERFGELMLKEESEEESSKEFQMALHELELMYTKDKLKDLAGKMSEYESKNDEDKLKEVQEQFRSFSKRLAQLQD